MSNQIFPFLAWSFVPEFATKTLQSLFYNLTIRAGNPKPQPGSPPHAKHRRRIYIAVIVAYLLYSLYEAHWDVRRQGDFYADLGVEHGVDEKALQSRFRKLTLIHHPDKITNPENRTAAEAYYVHLKLARDTLLDPARRFAYDRFGPDVTKWQHCVTIRDFLVQGVQATLPYYIGSGIVMVVFGWLGFLDWGRYWRYLTFLALLTFEVHTLTHLDFTYLTQLPTLLNPILTSLPPSLFRYLPTQLSLPQTPYLPFQTLRVAHKAVVTFFIALSRLGPLLQQQSSPASQGGGAGGDEKAQLERQVQRLEQTVGLTGLEAGRLLALEIVPFRAEEEDGVGDAGPGGGTRAGSATAGGGGGDGPIRGAVGNMHVAAKPGSGIRLLREKVKEWLVTNTIRSEREVQEAVARVIERRRRGGAAAEGEMGVGVE